MYKIGALAQAFGLKSDTLRFYEKNGLLSPSSRSKSGYRIYTEQDKQALSFIIRAKSVGFSLADIQELLSIEVNKSHSACADVKVVVDAKLAEVEKKMAELAYFQTSLQRLSNACCGTSESAEDCTILEALAQDIEQIHPEHHHKHKE